jgi:phosphoglycerol transferase
MKFSSKAPTLPTTLFSQIYKDWKWCLFGGVLSFFIASILMSGWPEGLRPNTEYLYSYSRDIIFHSWLAQRISEGWFFDNFRSGYPFGSNFLDFPGADTGHHLVIKALAAVTGNYFSAINLYFLIGFPVTFVFTYAVMRLFSLNKVFSFAGAMLFVLLPFHFQRLVHGHLFYTWYFVVPVFFLLALNILNYKNNKHPERKWLHKVFAVLGWFILASFGVYYAFFGLIVIATALFFALMNEGGVPTIKYASFACLCITIGVFLNLAPSIIHEQQVGKNIEAVDRSPIESEVYGLKMTHLLFPQEEHRVPVLNEFIKKYNTTAPLVNENSTASLGLIGALGFLMSFAVVAMTLAGRKIEKEVQFISLILMVLFLFATIAGLGAIFANLVTPLFRGLSRASVFIGFGALLVFFKLLQNIVQGKFDKKDWRLKVVSTGLAGVIASLGVYDQTNNPSREGNEKIKSDFLISRAFVQSIESAVLPNSAIYQLPYVPFPESPPLHNLGNYMLGEAFFQSKSLRWNFGGMKGRPGDLFFRSLSTESIQKQIDVIKKLGFSGIYVDKRGYEDQGEFIIREIIQTLQSKPLLQRADSEVVFFKIEPTNAVSSTPLSVEEASQRAGYLYTETEPFSGHVSAQQAHDINVDIKNYSVIGKHLYVNVTVHNNSSTKFNTLSHENKNIKLSWQLNPMGVPEDEVLKAWQVGSRRKAVSWTIPPNGSRDALLIFDTPQSGGKYVLQVSLVQEGVAWFHDLGFKIPSKVIDYQLTVDSTNK